MYVIKEKWLINIIYVCNKRKMVNKYYLWFILYWFILVYIVLVHNGLYLYWFILVYIVLVYIGLCIHDLDSSCISATMFFIRNSLISNSTEILLPTKCPPPSRVLNLWVNSSVSQDPAKTMNQSTSLKINPTKIINYLNQ